ncbi:MAG: tRNA pseudouridine(55) synthase TruB [Spirochaetae bacterium HGW-Spirochaetae-3]|nr:MAG: tRNA pseudouridine(55) synthase TruB [Spirochaetae bacterium HGW-Spirochaetae-3]
MIEASADTLSGFAILDKPAGITSYRFLGSMGRRLGDQVKSGHAGTLDSFASGVLVCLFGRYTRLSDYFMGAGKGYEADILFGEETDTLDPEGAVVATADIPGLAALEAALPAFRGDILQAPPAYSAVHIDGERAYERARKGQDVSPRPRPVTIHSLDLLSYEAGVARIRVSCTKGTYIRSLARDIALSCGSRGRLEALRRTFSGPFSEKDASSAEGFGPGDLRTLTEKDAEGLGLSVHTLDTDESRAFSNGLPLFRLASFASLDRPSPVAVFGAGRVPLGIVTRAGSAWKYAFVLGGLA